MSRLIGIYTVCKFIYFRLSISAIPQHIGFGRALILLTQAMTHARRDIFHGFLVDMEYWDRDKAVAKDFLRIAVALLLRISCGASYKPTV